MKLKLNVRSQCAVFCIFCFTSFTTIAQVLNDNTYHMEVHFAKAAGQIEKEVGWSEPTFIAHVVDDKDNAPTKLLDVRDGQDNKQSYCYTFKSSSTIHWGPEGDYNLGTILNSSSRSFDYDIFSWEHDGGKRCVWNATTDDNAGRNYGVVHTLYQKPTL